MYTIGSRFRPSGRRHLAEANDTQYKYAIVTGDAGLQNDLNSDDIGMVEEAYPDCIYADNDSRRFHMHFGDNIQEAESWLDDHGCFTYTYDREDTGETCSEWIDSEFGVQLPESEALKAERLLREFKTSNTAEILSIFMGTPYEETIIYGYSQGDFCYCWHPASLSREDAETGGYILMNVGVAVEVYEYEGGEWEPQYIAMVYGMPLEKEIAKELGIPAGKTLFVDSPEDLYDYMEEGRRHKAHSRRGRLSMSSRR